MLNERLEQLLTPVIESLGYELVLLEYQAGTHSAMLRLYIDAESGIRIEDCERVSREVAGVLDVEDPIRTAYQLEVSSPGLDRPLVRPAHYARFVGEQIKLQLSIPRGARKRFKGVIVSVSQQTVVVDTSEGRLEFEFSEIEQARLVPDYDRELAKS
ncbi:MAG: ribosome maturation factor RimP [Gammaproteobacteria bacterium]